MPKETSQAAIDFGMRSAEKLFKDRKGHGGGPCSYRTFRPHQIAALLALAYDAGADQAASKPRTPAGS